MNFDHHQQQTVRFLYSMCYTFIPNMRSVQPFLLEIPCLQLFSQFDKFWPQMTIDLHQQQQQWEQGQRIGERGRIVLPAKPEQKHDASIAASPLMSNLISSSEPAFFSMDSSWTRATPQNRRTIASHWVRLSCLPSIKTINIAVVIILSWYVTWRSKKGGRERVHVNF